MRPNALFSCRSYNRQAHKGRCSHVAWTQVVLRLYKLKPAWWTVPENGLTTSGAVQTGQWYDSCDLLQLTTWQQPFGPTELYILLHFNLSNFTWCLFYLVIAFFVLSNPHPHPCPGEKIGDTVLTNMNHCQTLQHWVVKNYSITLMILVHPHIIAKRISWSVSQSICSETLPHLAHTDR